jgi:hypothetical protein
MPKFLLPKGRAANSGPLLPLFAAAERARIRTLPLAARRLARRHGLPAATAIIIAELAYQAGGDR